MSIKSLRQKYRKSMRVKNTSRYDVVTSLLREYNQNDPTNRLILADALEEAGRSAEAWMVRYTTRPEIEHDRVWVRPLANSPSTMRRSINSADPDYERLRQEATEKFEQDYEQNGKQWESDWNSSDTSEQDKSMRTKTGLDRSPNDTDWSKVKPPPAEQVPVNDPIAEVEPVGGEEIDNQNTEEEEWEVPVEVRDSRDDLYDLMDANFTYGVVGEHEEVDPVQLHGGISNGDPREQKRVERLLSQVNSPKGYFERIVVDEEGNIIEGQHRYEVAKKLGWKRIPIVRVSDMGRVHGFDSMREAAMSANVSNLYSEQIDQIVKHAIDAINESGSKEKAIEDYEMPPSLQPTFEAAIRASAYTPTNRKKSLANPPRKRYNHYTKAGLDKNPGQNYFAQQPEETPMIDPVEPIVQQARSPLSEEQRREARRHVGTSLSNHRVDGAYDDAISDSLVDEIHNAGYDRPSVQNVLSQRFPDMPKGHQARLAREISHRFGNPEFYPENNFFEDFREDPTNVDNMAVYADYLEEQGDPSAPIARAIAAIVTTPDQAAQIVAALEQETGLTGYDLYDQLQHISGWFVNTEPNKTLLRQAVLANSPPPEMTQDGINEIANEIHGAANVPEAEESEDGTAWIIYGETGVGEYNDYAGWTVTVPKNDPENYTIEAQEVLVEEPDDDWDADDWEPDEEAGETEDDRPTEAPMNEYDAAEGIDGYVGEMVSGAIHDWLRANRRKPPQGKSFRKRIKSTDMPEITPVEDDNALPEIEQPIEFPDVVDQPTNPKLAAAMRKVADAVKDEPDVHRLHSIIDDLEYGDPSYQDVRKFQDEIGHIVSNNAGRTPGGFDPDSSGGKWQEEFLGQLTRGVEDAAHASPLRGLNGKQVMQWVQNKDWNAIQNYLLEYAIEQGADQNVENAIDSAVGTMEYNPLGGLAAFARYIDKEKNERGLTINDRAYQELCNLTPQFTKYDLDFYRKNPDRLASDLKDAMKRIEVEIQESIKQSKLAKMYGDSSGGMYYAELAKSQKEKIQAFRQIEERLIGASGNVPIAPQPNEKALRRKKSTDSDMPELEPIQDNDSIPEAVPIEPFKRETWSVREPSQKPPSADVDQSLIADIHENKYRNWDAVGVYSDVLEERGDRQAPIVRDIQRALGIVKDYMNAGRGEGVTLENLEDVIHRLAPHVGRYRWDSLSSTIDRLIEQESKRQSGEHRAYGPAGSMEVDLYIALRDLLKQGKQKSLLMRKSSPIHDDDMPPIEPVVDETAMPEVEAVQQPEDLETLRNQYREWLESDVEPASPQKVYRNAFLGYSDDDWNYASMATAADRDIVRAERELAFVGPGGSGEKLSSAARRLEDAQRTLDFLRPHQDKIIRSLLQKFPSNLNVNRITSMVSEGDFGPLRDYLVERFDNEQEVDDFLTYVGADPTRIKFDGESGIGNTLFYLFRLLGRSRQIKSLSRRKSTDQPEPIPPLEPIANDDSMPEPTPITDPNAMPEVEEAREWEPQVSQQEANEGVEEPPAKGSKEREPFAEQITGGGELGWFKVPALYDAAKKQGQKVSLPVSELESELEWWDGNEKHARSTDTKYPVLVLRLPDGSLTLADGLNRLWKRINVENKDNIEAYVLDVNKIPKSARTKQPKD